MNLPLTLRLGMAPVSRGASPDGSNADTALAAAPTPADSAAPPAAARLPTLAVAAAPMAAPALENLFKFNKKYIAVKQMLEPKIVESYSRKSRSRLPEENEQPPGDGGRDGKTGQAAQGGQCNLHCPRQPAGRRLREPDTSCVLNLKRKTKFFFKEIFPPATL